MKDFLLSWRIKQQPYCFNPAIENVWAQTLVRANTETEAFGKLREWYKKLMPTTWIELEIVNSTIE